jgi:nucleoside-diphosphate kinase
MGDFKRGSPAGGLRAHAMGWPPSGKTNLGPGPLVLHDAELAPRITETARGILKQMADDIPTDAGAAWQDDISGAKVRADRVDQYNRILTGEEEPTQEFWDDHPDLDYVLGSSRLAKGEACPAAATARLLAFTATDDGGTIAGYDDGSVWVRPPGPAGKGIAWAREAGPAWATAPARDRTLGMVKARVFGDERGATAFAAAASVAVFGLGLSIAKAKRFEMTEALAREFYREHAGRPYFGDLLESVVGTCTAIVMEGPGSVQKWRDAIGPSDPARWNPAHLRSQFGRVTGGNIANNGFHGSDSPESAEREIELLLPLLREEG